jgi:hypothetical protein
MRYPIGTMSIGDILGRGFRLLFARFALFYGIMLVLELPILALRLALPDLMAGGVGLLFLIAPMLILQMIGTGAMIRIIMQEYLDRPVGFGDAIRFALLRFWPLLGTSFLSGFFIFLGTLACFIPGIYLGLIYCVVSQVVIVEDQSGMDALKRSRSLATDYLGRIFGLFFLLGLFDRVVEGGLTFTLATVFPYVAVDRFGSIHVTDYSNYVLVTTLDVLVQIFFQAFTAICTTLLYFDLRNRKETFNLELEAEKLEAWTEHFRPRSTAPSQDIQQPDEGILQPGIPQPPRTDIQSSPTDLPPFRDQTEPRP